MSTPTYPERNVKNASEQVGQSIREAADRAAQAGHAAADQVSAKGHEAVDGASDLAHRAADKVGEIGHRAADRASGYAQHVADRVSEYREQIGEKSRVARGAVAHGIERTASAIRTHSPSLLSEKARSAADVMDDTAGYVRERRLTGMFSDLGETVRRNPGPSLFAAAAVGFLIGASMRRNSGK
jgi:ElaB/YqjD/DUF883 family membrane-anchored ribosome-binding protein